MRAAGTQSSRRRRRRLAVPQTPGGTEGRCADALAPSCPPEFRSRVHARTSSGPKAIETAAHASNPPTIHWWSVMARACSRALRFQVKEKTPSRRVETACLHRRGRAREMRP